YGLDDSFFFSSLTVPVDLSPEERSELEDIRRRKGVLLQEIQRLREELREAILEPHCYFTLNNIGFGVLVAMRWIVALIATVMDCVHTPVHHHFITFFTVISCIF
uniref:Uncharacterized protein n=1 Tax=Seriola lalandi dorsalis TaxID=1841481 RepID=A0A3B4X0Q9_SERLL